MTTTPPLSDCGNRLPPGTAITNHRTESVTSLLPPKQRRISTRQHSGQLTLTEVENLSAGHLLPIRNIYEDEVEGRRESLSSSPLYSEIMFAHILEGLPIKPMEVDDEPPTLARATSLQDISSVPPNISDVSSDLYLEAFYRV